MKKTILFIIIFAFAGCAGVKPGKCNCNVSLETVKEIKSDLAKQKFNAALEATTSKEHRKAFYRLVTQVRAMQKDHEGLYVKYLLLELHQYIEDMDRKGLLFKKSKKRKRR